MTAIVTPDEMRAIDAACEVPVEELIERAGWYVARRARVMLGGVYGRRVVVIVGPGNNGADGRVAARHLSTWGAHVEIAPGDVASIGPCDLVIDAAFGTGANRPYHPPVVPPTSQVLAVDIPSGVDGLTGEVAGEALAASHTVTFAALKPGLLLGPGAELAGRIEVADIGLDVTSSRALFFDEADAVRALPRRLSTDHKWKRSVYAVGGSTGMYGAPLLAAQAALRAGAGVVRCGLPGVGSPPVGGELLYTPLPLSGWETNVLDEAERYGSFVVGPGLGRSGDAGRGLRALLERRIGPMVIDGDGLRLLGEMPALYSGVVLTPHDGEYASLVGHAPDPDRFAAARLLAEASSATVLLKGPTTIVASPDGMCWASTSGDERLATAGTGDVLAGLIGSYLAAGLDSATAAILGSWVHGEAGLTQARFGMVASDLLDGVVEVSSRIATTAPDGENHAPN